MSNKKLIIYGNGETANIAYEYFTHDSDYEVAAFTVDKEFLVKNSNYGLDMIEFDKVEEQYPPTMYHIFVASSFT